LNAVSDVSARLPATGSILVIDSGVGGLSVCQSILAQQPRLQLIYFADSAFFPYGVLPENQLRERLKYIVSTMLSLHQPALVVLACNTVSTLVLPELRALFDIPFVGVVPAIKPAANLSLTKRIGLLATPATVNRSYTDQLISDYAQGCEVIKVGSSELVQEAEKLLRGQAVSANVLQMVLKPFKNEQGKPLVDTIVLGCTHFPLLRTQLAEQLPGINWVDSGQAIANRVSHLLASVTDMSKNVSSTHQIYFSKPVEDEAALTASFKHLGLHDFRLSSMGSDSNGT
jgi:glutamate racemase